MHMDINDLMLGPQLYLCTTLLGRAQFKPWGVKKEPYVTEVVLTNVLD